MDSGWFDSQIELSLNRDWCDNEFKGKNGSFFSRVQDSLNNHNVTHFSSNSLLNLLFNSREDDSIISFNDMPFVMMRSNERNLIMFKM